MFICISTTIIAFGENNSLKSLSIESLPKPLQHIQTQSINLHLIFGPIITIAPKIICRISIYVNLSLN